MGSNKPIAFRPTDELQKYIDAETKKDKTKSESQILNELFEKCLSYLGLAKEDQIMAPSQLPTGTILECPLRPMTVQILKGGTWVYPKREVDSSVCKTCPSYPCESWKQLEMAEKRV
jgi:hypothetical protein